MKSSPGKREVILASAQTLFLKHGLRGTSMEAIAREAGIAKPTLYAYFPDKAAIFSMLLEQLIATWRQDFLTALRGEGDVIKRVGAALTAKYKGSEVQVQFGTLPAKPATVYVTSPAIVGQAVAQIKALTELKLADPTAP